MSAHVTHGAAGAHAIRLSGTALDTIRAHGTTAYPYECCGALLGTAMDATTDVIEAWPLDNSTTEGPRRRFLVGPAEYREAEAQARASGSELVGFYHSHPDHPAEPSRYDLDHAWPNFSYVIVAVGNGAAGDLRSWRLREDRSGFDEELQT
jgi:proteasome lid subunit RPN8/RPN11